MKLIRMVGLAAVTVIAAMAFLVPSASASETNLALCATEGLTCASPLSHVHEVATNAKLLTKIFGSSITITCLSALFLGSIATTLALWLVISGNFSYSHCLTGSGASCTVEELNGPVNIESMKTGVEEAEVIGEGEVLVDCSTTPHCVYNGTNLIGEGLGPLLAAPNGEVKLEEATVNQVEGAFCPETSKLDALFKPLSAVYISS